MAELTQISIVGASARAAAMSARRAGLFVWAADLFADEDLRACADARKIERYPDGLPQLLRAAPLAPWMYTGALENEPELIDQLATIQPLLGTRGDALRQCRNPLVVSNVLRTHGLSAAECLAPEAFRSLRAAADWLVKPLTSANGRGIRRLASGQPPCAGEYLQRFVPGQSISAAFVAGGRQVTLLGVTRQLLGRDWLPPPLNEQHSFRYCGSLGPLRLSREHEHILNRIGTTLADSFQLVGLFGVDLIDAGDTLVAVEINPRYTASMEILERGAAPSVVAMHIAAVASGSCSWKRQFNDAIHAKLILYAPTPWNMTDRFCRWMDLKNSAAPWPIVADIPSLGMRFETGQPVCTLFASAATESAANELLRKLAAEALDAAEVALPRGARFG